MLIYDLVGVGFGPSNLALAIALTEHNAQVDVENTVITAQFLERQSQFGWHRGMLIDDATMQVSFLKDLVTLRNPTSDFTFLCYLRGQGRLVDFINHKTLFPLRVEFHDYFEWAAARVDELVAYGQEVESVTPVLRSGRIEFLDVTVRTSGGEPVVYRARNLVLGTGLTARVPDGVTLSDRVWHNSELLARVDRMSQADASRFVVVGAGQSAAETAAFLHRRFPRAEVCAVFARYGYSPADDSAFANRIFDPAAVDRYFDAREPVRQMLIDYHANTNYSVVDVDLIDDLYRRMYQEKVLGTSRFRMFNVSRLTDLEQTAAGIRVIIRSLTDGDTTTLDADVVVYATGYRPADPLALLGEVGKLCHRDEQDRPRVMRDYRLSASPELACGIYLQGATEHTHGITSSLLSNTAVRVGEILESIVDHGDTRS